MTMTVRQLLSVLNHMPQDMPVDAGSITITDGGVLRLVSENLETPAWNSNETRDEIAEIINFHNDEVVSTILVWMLTEVYSDDVAKMLNALYGRDVQNNRETAETLLNDLDDLDLSALDMFLDQYFEDNPDLV